MTWIRENNMQISQFFVNGDIKGAIAYMRDHEEFKDILPAYVAIFEDQKYRTYEIPDNLNDILRLYQIYFGTPYLRLTRAHTVFAGINAVWHCAVHRQAPACHLRRASPYSISAAQKLHRTFRRGKIR